MNRKLSDWSSIAEIVAAIGVILSLLFVGLQVRDGNRETVAATMQAALDSEMHFQSTVALHAGTWYKVRSGQELQVGEEVTRGIALYNMLLTVIENRFHQFNSGYLDRPVSELVATVADWPIYDAWRLTGGATSRSPEFQKLIDEVRASQILDE
jgi:hypothetical protein